MSNIKTQYREKLVAEFFSKNSTFDSAQISQILEIIDDNISFAVKTHEKNKELLEELADFANLDLAGYNKFCDKFLRKKIGDVIGIDSVFIYTHSHSYQAELSREFEIEMQDEVLKLIKNYADFLLKENIEQALEKKSWLSKLIQKE